ncbi:hypothetical protein WDU94_011019 [Cyamophila willieti]
MVRVSVSVGRSVCLSCRVCLCQKDISRTPNCQSTDRLSNYHTKTIMYSRPVLQLALPCLLVTMFHLSCGGEDSTGVDWKDVDVGKDTWTGIKNFSGKDLCAEKRCDDLGMFVWNHFNYTGGRHFADCEPDKNLADRTVCWVRHKVTPPAGRIDIFKTSLEVQLWLEGTTSHCRYATHKL